MLHGTLVTFNEVAPLTRLGRPVVCLPGSITPAAGVLEVDLEHTGDAIGVVDALDLDADRIRVAVAVDPPADVVGLSPLLDIRVGYLNPAGDTYIVEAAVLTRVALTARPAFPSSLLDDGPR